MSNRKIVVDMFRVCGRALYELDEVIYDRAMKNFMDRVITCRASRRGRHIPDIIFHV
jgi:hypothetical protein